MGVCDGVSPITRDGFADGCTLGLTEKRCSVVVSVRVSSGMSLTVNMLVAAYSPRLKWLSLTLCVVSAVGGTTRQCRLLNSPREVKRGNRTAFAPRVPQTVAMFAPWRHVSYTNLYIYVRLEYALYLTIVQSSPKTR